MINVRERLNVTGDGFGRPKQRSGRKTCWLERKHARLRLKLHVGGVAVVARVVAAKTAVAPDVAVAAVLMAAVKR